MMWRGISAIGLVCLHHMACGQSVNIVPGTPGEIKPLVDRYLSDRDSADYKVRVLVSDARKDGGEGRWVDAMQKLQVALALEALPEVTDIARFDLFHTLADHTYRFHPVYADIFYQRASAIAAGGAIDADRIFVVSTNRAGFFVKEGQPDSAAFYYALAIRQTDQISPVAHASALNNFGYFYEGQNHLDSAVVYYRKALEVLDRPENEIILYCSIRDNLASVAKRGKAYTFVEDVYKTNDSVYFSLALHNRYLVNGVRWLELKIMRQEANIEDWIRHLDAFSSQYESNILPASRLAFYRSAADYFAQHHDVDPYTYFNTLYLALRDSTEQSAADQIYYLTSGLMEVQAMHFRREMEYQSELGRQRQARLRLVMVLAIVLCLAAGLIIFTLWRLMRQRRLRHEAEQLASAAELRAREMEARLIEQELKHKEQDLTQVVLHNTHVHDQQQQILERLTGLQTEKPDAMAVGIRGLIHDLSAQNRLGEDRLSLQSKMEDINAAFFSRLADRFPNLTKTEQELCGFLRIQLSTKDISLLRNVEASSIKMSKNRLRKKLGLDPSVDLYSFVQSI